MGSGLADRSRLEIMAPQPYPRFIAMLRHASIILTDSASAWEEVLVLNTPCVTARDATEWPSSIRFHRNLEVGYDPEKIKAAVGQLLPGQPTYDELPASWDGLAAGRVLATLRDRYDI